jgi:hypothetical protein
MQALGILSLLILDNDSMSSSCIFNMKRFSGHRAFTLGCGEVPIKLKNDK